MTSSFYSAHVFTAKWEGGLSDHPADPGGITHYGVSLRWLKQLEEEYQQGLEAHLRTSDGSNAWDSSPYDFNHDGTVDANDIRTCTKEDAAKLMHDNFWKPLNCQELPLALGTVLYDSAVNMGPYQATKILQESCNIVGEAHLDVFTPLVIDGRCGPKTIAMCKSLKLHNLDFYTARMAVRHRTQFYVRLANQKESLAVFLKGWKNRCQDLLTHLASIERGA